MTVGERIPRTTTPAVDGRIQLDQDSHQTLCAAATAATTTLGSNTISTSIWNHRRPLQSLQVNATPSKTIPRSTQSLRERNKTEEKLVGSSPNSCNSKTIMESMKTRGSEGNNVSIPTREVHSQSSTYTSSIEEQVALSDVFRSIVWIEPTSDDEDMWTLKRASPVYESDEEFCQYESPIKRKKTESLDLEDRLSSDDEVLSLLH